MIAAIAEWLRHLVTLILLAIVLDAVLPSDTMQRYARTVVGLVIMLSLLSPLRALMQSGFNIGQFTAQIAGPLWVQDAAINQAEPQVFRQDLAITVKQAVETTSGVTLQWVHIQTREMPDGTLVVTGANLNLVLANGIQPARMVPQIQAQVAVLLGLSVQAVNISYIT